MKYAILINLILFFYSANAQTDAVYRNQINQVDGLALQGYDPVAYFILNKAVKGKPEIEYTYKGVTYYFSTVTHREIFIKTPQKYEPEYGGWCAFAMGDYGEKVKVDPETFKITNGKLYLFYNFFFNNTLTSWNKKENQLIKQANINWIKLTR